MHISFCLTVVSVVSTSCLASAFSTLFVTEGAGEGRKTEETGTRTQKMEENSVAENQVIVETVPFFTDIFTRAEDAMNLTPLKIATIISAQHLLDTVKAIPVSGNHPSDTLNMLGGIVDEFNKTTQIIKLTSEYVNISSHYILNSLNQYAKENCDQDYVQNTMKTINRNFLRVISNHIKLAVKEITEKTEQREMTGTDVLVSSAYHIVAAFQEMTNQVMSLKIDSTKCNLPKTPQNSEQVDVMENNQTDNTIVISKQGHKSIKKDQALSNNEPFTFSNRGNLKDSLTIENVDGNPDLTIEIFPREPLFLNNKDNKPSAKQEVKIPESLKVAFLPEETRTKVKNNKLNKQENQFQPRLGSDNTKNKMTKENLKNFGDMFTFENVNPNEELAVKILSPQNIVYGKKQESPSQTNENKQQKLERFNVYYYPLKTTDQNQVSNANGGNNLQVPEDLQVHYYPQSLKTQNLHREKLKQGFTPSETLSLFGNSYLRNYKNGKQQKQEHSKTKSEGSQTKLKSFGFDDTLTLENLNRQDLTVEVFSPEALMHNGKYNEGKEIMDLSDMRDIKYPAKVEWRLGNLENRYPKRNHDSKNVYRKNPKMKTFDRELASSAVDSLSNVPPTSFESEIKSLRGRKATKSIVNSQKGLPTVLLPWGKGTQQFKFQNPLFRKNQPKHYSCDEKVEPVCGIDKNKSNFIIFLNDCQRKHHNNAYKTSYQRANMDTCVGFLLKYSSGKSTKYMNVIP